MDIDIERGGCNDIMGEDDSTALCVSIDELKKIGQVIRNLITNAIKFTPAEETAAATYFLGPSGKRKADQQKTSDQECERAGSFCRKEWLQSGGPRGLRGYRYWGRDCARDVGEGIRQVRAV